MMGRYALQEVIGRGGMGTVYQALDTTLDRLVAIKFINQNDMPDHEFVDRFFREARATAKLQHPNIIQVFDMGQEGSDYYMVMELLEGSTLKDLIQAQAPLSVPEAIRITVEILRGLGEAHQVGVIHRDIKPQNILRSKQNHWKLADFGIAHMESASTKLTKTGMMMGTVHYFSPEQARGEAVSYGSDLYSVGIMLYEMLTGYLPFDADEGIAIAIKHLQAPVPDPRAIRPDLPEAICHVLFRALEKTLDRRYQSAEEMIQDLQAINGQPSIPAVTTVLSTQESLPPVDRTASRKFQTRMQNTLQTPVISSTEQVEPVLHDSNQTPGEWNHGSEPKKSKKGITFLVIVLALVGGFFWYQSDDSTPTNSTGEEFDLEGLTKPSGAVQAESSRDKLLKELYKAKTTKSEGNLTELVGSTEHSYDVRIRGTKDYEVLNTNTNTAFSRQENQCSKGDNNSNFQTIDCDDSNISEMERIVGMEKTLLDGMIEDKDSVTLYKSDDKGYILHYKISSTDLILDQLDEWEEKNWLKGDITYKNGIYEIQLTYNSNKKLTKIQRILKLENDSYGRPNVMVEQTMTISK